MGSPPVLGVWTSPFQPRAWGRSARGGHTYGWLAMTCAHFSL